MLENQLARLRLTSSIPPLNIRSWNEVATGLSIRPNQAVTRLAGIHSILPTCSSNHSPGNGATVKAIAIGVTVATASPAIRFRRAHTRRQRLAASKVYKRHHVDSRRHGRRLLSPARTAGHSDQSTPTSVSTARLCRHVTRCNW